MLRPALDLGNAPSTIATARPPTGS